MRRTTWPMTRFFSTVRPGRPSARTPTSPRLKALIGLRWLNKARRVRPALKGRLVRKAPPGRPVRNARAPALAPNGRTVRPLPTGHKNQLAHQLLRGRRGRNDLICSSQGALRRITSLFPYTTLFRPPGRPSARTPTSPRLKALIGLRWLNKARRVRPALKGRLVRKAPPGRPV